jgi:hypothetical protein
LPALILHDLFLKKIVNSFPVIIFILMGSLLKIIYGGRILYEEKEKLGK